MGWLWGSNDDNKSKPSQSSEDPLRHLDPSLREFLKKESPVKYGSSNPPAAPQAHPSPPEPAQPIEATVKDTPQVDQNPSLVPKESLYQDGRYAHIWKTYQPQKEAAFESKSDTEKINDILDGYKTRRAEIGRAAVENCALEQWKLNECFRTGSLQQTLTMCRTENRAMDRCYMMQARFLKALGYLSTAEREPEVDEEIQMRADTLFHRMLKQEEEIEKAKEEGRPIPTFSPLITSNKLKDDSSATSTPSSSESDTQSGLSESEKALKARLSPSIQASLDERLNSLSPIERELEVEAIKAEYRAGERVATSLGSIYQKQEDEKRARKENGKETIGDYLSSLFK